jgi:hypothetical protein
LRFCQIRLQASLVKCWQQFLFFGCVLTTLLLFGSFCPVSFLHWLLGLLSSLKAIAYTLATFHGESIQQLGVRNYVCRSTESSRFVERHSHFWIGLHGQLWVDSMADFSDLMFRLVSLKPHKRLNFQQGLAALSILQSAF